MKSFISHLNESMLEKLLTMKVRKSIKNAGGKIYQIGGVVRDELLGKVSKDLDLIVVGVELRDLESILKPHGKVNMVGKSFGILKFVPTGSTEEEDVDISVPRVDSKSTGAGHKDFEVQLGKGITLQQDQLRRDFWINQLAKDVDTGEIIDTDGKGMKDIKNKEIRMISPTSFEDDPLRMLRAIQFAARFEFKIEKNTFKEMKKQAHTISSVSSDRFNEEFKKLFTKSKKPSIGVKLLFESGLIKHLFPKASIKDINLKALDKLETFDGFNKNYGAFIGMVLMSYKQDAGKIAKAGMKLSNIDSKAVQSVTSYKDMDLVKLVGWAKDNDIKSVDAYLTAIGKPTVSSKLEGVKYLSIKELPINGKDVSQLGFKGKSIGDALQSALDFSIKTNKTSKNDLLKYINSKNK